VAAFTEDLVHLDTVQQLGKIPGLSQLKVVENGAVKGVLGEEVVHEHGRLLSQAVGPLDCLLHITGCVGGMHNDDPRRPL
jgi:hypothetical protein